MLYELYDLALSWPDAEAFCESRGGTLACPSTGGEWDAVYALSASGSKGYYWLGGTDGGSEVAGSTPGPPGATPRCSTTA